METKEQLVTAIRDWVRIDNEMRKLKNEINIRKNEFNQSYLHARHVILSFIYSCYFRSNDD